MLRAYGVLLRLQDGGRVYWLPGVGCFSLLLRRGPDQPPLTGGPLGPLHRELEVRIRATGQTYGRPSMRVKDELHVLVELVDEDAARKGLRASRLYDQHLPRVVREPPIRRPRLT